MNQPTERRPPDARTHRNRCLAPASQRCRPHPDVARKAAAKLGVTIEFLSPQGFTSVPVPTYPGLRLALPGRREIARRIERFDPDAIHIATEGPIGYQVRAYCRKHGHAFTTSYTTRFPEYIAARFPLPESWSYAALRRFHAAARPSP